jgi:hypothetical protein
MARSRTAPPKQTLRSTILALVTGRIPFSVHYPTKNSMVITCDPGLNQAQLRVAVEQGASFGPDRNLMILVPKLSNDG